MLFTPLSLWWRFLDSVFCLAIPELNGPLLLIIVSRGIQITARLSAPVFLDFISLAAFGFLPVFSDRADISKVPDRVKTQLRQAAVLSSISAARICGLQSPDTQEQETMSTTVDSSPYLPCPPRRRLPVSDIHVLPLGAVNRIMFPLFPSPEILLSR